MKIGKVGLARMFFQCCEEENITKCPNTTLDHNLNP